MQSSLAWSSPKDVYPLSLSSVLYNTALRESEYTNYVEYIEGRKNKEPVQKRKHARKITWFNPPFSKNITTQVGQKFLKLIDKHFPVGSKLQKVFNRNMIKVSYSCRPVRSSQTGGVLLPSKWNSSHASLFNYSYYY